MIKWPEIQYREAEDGMLYPIIDFPKQPAGDIGKYGRMHKDYLEKHRPVTYMVPNSTPSYGNTLSNQTLLTAQASNAHFPLLLCCLLH